MAAGVRSFAAGVRGITAGDTALAARVAAFAAGVTRFAVAIIVFAAAVIVSATRAAATGVTALAVGDTALVDSAGTGTGDLTDGGAVSEQADVESGRAERLNTRVEAALRLFGSEVAPEVGGNSSRPVGNDAIQSTHI